MPDPRLGRRNVVPADIRDDTTARVVQSLTDAQARLAQAQAAPVASAGAWTAVAVFANGWTNFGPPYFNVAYRIDADGTVRLRGLLSGGTNTLTAFTLPLGFRPLSRLIFTCTGGAATTATMIIEADGSVIPETSNNTFATLDGITFSVD